MDRAVLKEIGLRIARRRKELNMTQEKLAEQMGVSIQLISNLERGNKAIRIDNLIKLSGTLRVSTDYILTGKKVETAGLLEKFDQLSEQDYRIIIAMVNTLLEER